MEIPPILELTNEFHRGAFFRSLTPEGAKVLEIGGGYNPFYSKSEGPNIFTADRASREELVAEYTLLNGVGPERASRIEPVDFVCADGDVSKAVPKDQWGTFDVLMSSHNLEHIPDPIAYFQSADRLLTESGKLLLAIPDKRACFDLMRPTTTSSSWIEAHIRGDQRHSFKTRFDHDVYTIGNAGECTWLRGTLLDKIALSEHPIWTVPDRIQSESGYVDSHAWTFTPSSFLLMAFEIQSMGFISLLPTAIFDGGGEFVVSLSRAPANRISTADRLRLLKQSCLEQLDGFKYIAV